MSQPNPKRPSAPQTPESEETQSQTRREMLRHLMLGAGAVAVAPLVGCGAGPDPVDASMADSGTDASIDSGLDAAADASVDAPEDAGPIAWASGGTVAMVAKATYPSPFGALPDSCLEVQPTTAGPCTTEDDLDREDISEEWSGLPMRVALKILTPDCAPLANATVSIWHTNIEGSYSGETPSDRCYFDSDYAMQNFFRGVQTSNEDGEVFFDSCFPGWYPGRAIHIHFEVRTAERSYKISQLFFPDELITEIFGTHPEYVSFGQPDTSNDTDGVTARLDASARAALTFEIAKMSDGAMLASKVVTVGA